MVVFKNCCSAFNFINSIFLYYLGFPSQQFFYTNKLTKNMGKRYYKITLYGSRRDVRYVEEVYIESEGKVKIRGHPPSASKSQLEEITKEDMEKVLRSQNKSHETSE